MSKAIETAVEPAWMKPIIHVPLTQAFPQFKEVKEFRSKVCLFSHDRSRVFDVVSSKYQVIEHGEAFRRIKTGLEEYFGVAEVTSSVRSIADGARIRAEFKLPLPQLAVKKGDVSEITLVLRNSYDRAWSFSAVLGAWRQVCSNGMMIGEKFGSIKGKHVGGTEGAMLLDQLDSILRRAPLLQQQWREWASMRVTFDEAVELLEGKFPKKYLDTVLHGSVYPTSMWELYNRCTSFATHQTSSIQRRVEFDERIAKLFYGGDLVTVEGDYEEVESD